MSERLPGGTLPAAATLVRVRVRGVGVVGPGWLGFLGPRLRGEGSGARPAPAPTAGAPRVLRDPINSAFTR